MVNRYFDDSFEARAFGDIGANQLEDAVAKFGSFIAVVQAVRPQIPAVDFYNTIIEVSSLIAPEHRGVVLGENELVAKPAAFLRGATLALCGLKLMVSHDEITWAQNNTVLAFPDKDAFKDDLLEYRHAVASAVMSYGAEGYSRASAYNRVFESVEDELCPSFEHLNAAKAGFGFPFYVLYKSFELDRIQFEDDLKAFETELEDFDADSYWDNVLKSL